jgi:hypothetical protein
MTMVEVFIVSRAGAISGRRMTTLSEAEYGAVKLEEALVEPDGFYANLSNVDTVNRRLVLIRLPEDVLDYYRLKLFG